MAEPLESFGQKAPGDGASKQVYYMFIIDSEMFYMLQQLMCV